MIARADVVAAARRWIGTPWQHQGRVFGRAVDCVGLVLAAACEAGCIGQEQRLAIELAGSGYGRAPDGRLLPLLRAWLQEIPLAQAQPGDVLALRFEVEPQHVAVVGEYAGASTLIHAYARARRVVEHRLDDAWRGRLVAAFRLPGVA